MKRKKTEVNVAPQPLQFALTPLVQLAHVRQQALPREKLAGSGEKVSSQEYERMRRELAKVKTERGVFKKSLGHFAADLK